MAVSKTPLITISKTAPAPIFAKKTYSPIVVPTKSALCHWGGGSVVWGQACMQTVRGLPTPKGFPAWTWL